VIGVGDTLQQAIAGPPRIEREVCLRCRDVTVSFFSGRQSVTAIQDVSLDVTRGEFLALLGPSGCGKSTLLRLVAGLIQPTAGVMEVLGTSPVIAQKRRDIGFVFQDAALLPWRTALENVALPLEVSQEDPGNARAKCEEMLDFMGLGARKHAYPHELSGGMRQRVSIARALVSNPKILLMDEPFAALDEITRDRLNEELRRIWKQTGVTILFVTHGIYEAAYLGQRVLMLAANPGRIREIVPVKLAEDRTLSIRESGEFIALATRLRQLMEVGT
jgi:NitT/TauT family transport system ATP-binding protein